MSLLRTLLICLVIDRNSEEDLIINYILKMLSVSTDTAIIDLETKCYEMLGNKSSIILPSDSLEDLS